MKKKKKQRALWIESLTCTSRSAPISFRSPSPSAPRVTKNNKYKSGNHHPAEWAGAATNRFSLFTIKQAEADKRIFTHCHCASIYPTTMKVHRGKTTRLGREQRKIHLSRPTMNPRETAQRRRQLVHLIDVPF